MAADAGWLHDGPAHAWWVEPGRVLAGEYPGTGRGDATKLDILLDAGVRTFVDLTTAADPLEPYEDALAERARARGLDLRHRRFPIPDFGTIDLSGYASIVEHVRREVAEGRPVVRPLLGRHRPDRHRRRVPAGRRTGWTATSCWPRSPCSARARARRSAGAPSPTNRWRCSGRGWPGFADGSVDRGQHRPDEALAARVALVSKRRSFITYPNATPVAGSAKASDPPAPAWPKHARRVRGAEAARRA